MRLFHKLQSMLTMPRTIKNLLGVLILSAVITPAGAWWDPNDLTDISTTNLYGITAALAKENPKLDKVALIAMRPIAADRAAALVATGGFPWMSGQFGLFLVNPVSSKVIRSIALFKPINPGRTMAEIRTAGPGYVTVVQEDADSDGEVARDKYFVDELSTAPSVSHSYKPVSINSITSFNGSLYFTGRHDGNGVIIRLGLKDGKPVPGDWELVRDIAGKKLAPVVFSKVESGSLSLYTSTETYVTKGLSWTRTAGPDARYFRPQKDPCADISTDDIGKDFTLYEKCDKERKIQGDAALVGYEGRCETENPGEYAGLPDSYTGVMDRHEISARLIDISKTPLRRFFIWTTGAYYNRQWPTGIYEIKADSCRFYPMPMPDKNILKRYRPDKAKEGCGLNDKLGPFQKLGDSIWFCKYFYGGEGECGVGAAGFFDTKAKVFEILYSSHTAKWSCSALLAEEKTVWMGLEHIGEGWGKTGGLASVNTATGEATIHDIPAGISAIQRAGDSIVLGTGEGIYILSSEGKIFFAGPDADKAGNYMLHWE